MLVQDGLQRNGRRRPDKIALVCAGQRLTYAEVDAMADRLANALLAYGVKRGDRVGIYLHNTVEAVVGIFGALKAGATFVVINRAMRFEKLCCILANCQATALVTDSGVSTQGTVSKLLSRSTQLRFVVLAGINPGESIANDRQISFDAIQERFPAVRPRINSIDLDLACLVYTSGSTGEPKGVMCDHSNVVFVANSVITYLENTDADVVLNVLPLSFSYGLYQVLMTFTFGGTLVLESTFAYPVIFLQRIAQERVTGFSGVPTIFSALLQMDLSRFDLSSLRYVTNAAAALPPSHIQQLLGKLPDVKLYSMYGQTETKRTLYLPPDQLRTRPGSVGIAIPGTEVWIEGLDGARLGPNQIGELVVRGRHVMRGYWQAPEATAERFRPGPLPGERICYTGDLFRMDEEGYLYFVSRKDDIINTRGEKVAPKEVENVLHRLPGVAEAAVLGVPDPVLGEAIKAVLVADTSRVTKADVLKHCRAHLEDFMVPKYLELRDQLPKTSSGKVLRRELL
jgi:amino acid adenylation domain-containing protein